MPRAVPWRGSAYEEVWMDCYRVCFSGNWLDRDVCYLWNKRLRAFGSPECNGASGSSSGGGAARSDFRASGNARACGDPRSGRGTNRSCRAYHRPSGWNP